MPDSVAKLDVATVQGGARYSAAVLGLTALLCVAAIGLNVAVDPRAEFGVPAFQTLVVDHGVEKLPRYEAREPRPEWVILGSSRVLVLPPDELPWVEDGRGFNFGVAGAQPADHDLLARYLAAQEPPPEGVVLGLDDFAVSQDDRAILSISGAYAELGGPPEPWTEKVGLAAGSLTAGYVGDTLRVLQYNLVTGYPVGAESFADDGTATEVAFEQDIADGSFDLEARLENHFDRVVAERYGDEAVVRPESVELIGHAFDVLQQTGMQVKAFIPPMHPYALDRLAGNERHEAFHQETLRLLLARCGPGFQVYDFTEIESFGGEPSEFYDNYHLRPANAERLATALGDDSKDLCAEPAA